MKLRIGFVSNSSTSIYICEICGHGIVQCQCDGVDDIKWCTDGHTMHHACLEKLGIDPFDEEINDKYDGELPKDICPICSGTFTIPPDVKTFIEEVHRRLVY